MKGRQNYLCPRRLERALQQANELFTTSEANRAGSGSRIGRARPRDGSLSDLRDRARSESLDTSLQRSAHLHGQDVRPALELFLSAGAQTLLAADVIVINHTLLFMLLGGADEQEERESGYLFPNDFIIFDEAHTLEQVASRQIGIGVSQYGLRSTIQRLYNARTRKGLFTVTRDAAGVTLAADAGRRSRPILSARSNERCDFRKGREVPRARIGFCCRTRLPARLIALQARIAEVVKRDRGRISESRAAGAGPAHSRCARRDRRPFSNKAREEHVYWVERTGKDGAIPLAERRADRHRAGPAAHAFSRGLFLRHDQRDAGSGPAGPRLFPRTHRRRTKPNRCSSEVRSISTGR